MIWPRRDRPDFVEAAPGLAERLEELFRRRPAGRARWLAATAVVAWSAATAPLRLFRLGVDAAGGLVHAGGDGLRVRRVRHLVQGLPAVAGVCSTAAAGLLVAGGATDLPDTYRHAAAGAYSSGRDAEAELLYQRLFRLDGGRAETRLLLGLTLERLGRPEEAEAIIRGVADGDGGGDPRANRWVAAKLSGDPATATDPAKAAELHRQLLAAERGLPGDAGVALGLARFYRATGQIEPAIARLEAAAKTMPAAHLDLAALHAAAGRGDAAARALEKAEAAFRSALERNPEDRQARLLLANCLVATRRFDEAASVLAAGNAADPQGPYRAALASVYLAAYDLLAARGDADPAKMIELLKEALGQDPNSAAAAVRLAEFGAAGSAAGREAAEAEATAMLERLLASGEQPAAVHMALGLRASRRGDSAAATWHFERAYDLDASLAGVANNLAWMLTHAEEPDLDRALSILTPVLEQWPDVPSYRDTRGEIYLRMGRYDDALRDFERALPGLKSDPRLHRSMAEVYERLGRPRLAEIHREEANKLDDARGSPRPGKGHAPPSAGDPAGRSGAGGGTAGLTG